MTSRIETRRVKVPWPSEADAGDPFAGFVLEEEENAPCSEYLVMSQRRHMPALQEYLHELHEHGAQAFQ